MSRTLRRTRATLRAAGLAVALAVPLSPVALAPAFGQDAPPPPSGGRSYSPLPGYGILVVFGGIVVAVSLWSSKRSHQDL